MYYSKFCLLGRFLFLWYFRVPLRRGCDDLMTGTNLLCNKALCFPSSVVWLYGTPHGSTGICGGRDTEIVEVGTMESEFSAHMNFLCLWDTWVYLL